MTPEQERLLEEFLRSTAAADWAGKLERLGDAQDRLTDMFLRQEEEHRTTALELRGDIRGVSLRVGALEVAHAGLKARTESLEKRDESHEKRLEDSQSWILTDLEKKKAKAEGIVDMLKDPRSIATIVSTAIAIGTMVWHFLSPLFR